jgi:hypothetical protein
LSSIPASSSAPPPASSLPASSSGSGSPSASSISLSSPLTISSAYTTIADWVCCCSGSKSGLSRRAVGGGEASPPAAAVPAVGAFLLGVDCMGAVCFEGNLRFFKGRRACGLTPCSNGCVATRARFGIRTTSNRFEWAYRNCNTKNRVSIGDRSNARSLTNVRVIVPGSCISLYERLGAS